MSGTSPRIKKDTNGNEISEITTVISSTQYDTYFTDTLGRKIPFPPENFVDDLNIEDPSTSNYTGCTGSLPISSAVLWTPPGPGGGEVTYKFCYATLAIQTDFQLAGVTEASGSETVLQSVVLPNGTAWTFGYNSYTDLTEVGFPTGGSIAYTYSNVIFFPPSESCAPIPCTSMSRAVATRTTNANDGTGTHTWTYGWGPVETGTPATMTNSVTDPLGNQTVYANEMLDTWRETSREIFQGPHTAGKTLETISTAWSPGVTPLSYTVPLPLSVTTAWENGQTKQVQTDWDSNLAGLSYGNVIARREYDYGAGSPGPLLRTTTTQYEAFINSAYLTSNLLSLPSSVQVTDNTGTQRAYTTYGYNSATTGNLTSVGKWLNTTGGYLTNSFTYFANGTMQTSVDPNNNKTTYAYSSTYAGAYPTSITNPLGQITQHGYDFNTGLLTSTTDANNQTTSFTYDNMWRLATTTYPDGGSDSITHQETTFPFSAKLTKPITTALNFVTTNVFDGLGRMAQTQLNSDPSGVVYVDTTYDSDGRKYTVSNPYRTKTDSSYGITSTVYDVLGRTCVVIPPRRDLCRQHILSCYAAFQ